jgi:hypothetical protein
MIFVMGLTMLKMDRAKAKWRVKLQLAFEVRILSYPSLIFLLHYLLCKRD